MRKYHVEVNGAPYEVVISEITDDKAEAPASSESRQISKNTASLSTAETVTAPMPGNILKVNISAGQAVKSGDILMILEAMKMENEIMASKDGTVSSVQVREGGSVESGEVLCTIS